MLEPLTGFTDRVKTEGLNVLSVRVRQGGQLQGAWDREKDERRLQHSVSKSFTAMAVGLALEEGLLSLETELREFFDPGISAGAAGDPRLVPDGITLYNLLRMSTGHDEPPLWAPERESLQEKDWAKYYMSLPLNRVPGERFTYSSGDTFMISALFEAAAGHTVKDYLVPRLFEPLGIRDVRWDTSPLGITLGCTGLYISNEELSRFGQLLLQKGSWEGRQLVPAHWIDFAASKQMETDGGGDWGQGYGCQFWMCTHGAYRADGANGQFCIVIPNRDAVIAINSDEGRMQEILDAVWAEIYPLL